MEHYKIDGLSESEQMYLLTMAKINEAGQEFPIPVSHLAEALDVIPVSVHQMIRKLSQKQLLEYEPYKGVSLTPQGLSIAYQVLRSRRLWSVFLTEKLNLSPEEADELACHFEHFTSPELCERLSRYLENPQTDPFGNPIPQGKTTPKSHQGVKLTNLNIGAGARIFQIPEEDSVRAFLSNEGITPGSEIKLQAIGENKELLLKTKGHYVYLSSEIASQITIQVNTKNNQRYNKKP